MELCQVKNNSIYEPLIHNEQITERVKKLILTNKVSDYYVSKNANIPKSSLSRMINNTQEWRMQYLLSIAVLFKVDIEWLLFGKAKYMIEELVTENKTLKEEVMLLREKVATYEVAAEIASQIKSKTKSKKYKEKSK